MPYKPRLRHLFLILFRRRDPGAAEGLFYEGTYLAERGEEKDARMAFRHSALLDGRFAGARYNYAALTEKLLGAHAETVEAWEDYARVAFDDPRQRRETIFRVQEHVGVLRARIGKGVP